MSDQQEGMESMTASWRGQKGDKGDRGERGMTIGARRAVIYLFVLTVLLSGANLAWTGHETRASQAAQARTQAAQRRAGVLTEAKLCQTFGALAALKPPAGNASANPSRAYEQDQHAILSQIGADLGCKEGH